MLLALDPGIRGCGAALYRERVLAAAAYIPNPIKTGDEPEAVVEMARAVYAWASLHEFNPRIAGEIVIEWPRVYVAGRSKGDNNDLLPLPAVGCALAAFAYPAQVSRYRPDEWKGQLEKEDVEKRLFGDLSSPVPIAARLDPHEQAIVRHAAERAKSKAHNMIEAVAIGLKRLDRFERKRVIAR